METIGESDPDTGRMIKDRKKHMKRTEK